MAKTDKRCRACKDTEVSDWYLWGLLRLQLPHQLTLLRHTGIGAEARLCRRGRRRWCGGGRGHAWFVVQACLLLELSLRGERRCQNHPKE